jgi:hypothetical protein
MTSGNKQKETVAALADASTAGGFSIALHVPARTSRLEH